MNKKRTTQRNRAVAVNKIKQLMLILCKEDLFEVQRSIEDLLPSAPSAPPETPPERHPVEWLEERHYPSGSPLVRDSYFVYRCWINSSGKEKDKVIFHGTLAEYEAKRLEDLSQIRT